MRSARSVVVLVLAAFGVSCGDSTGSGPGVETIQVTPNPITLVRFDSVQTAVSALDHDGHLVTGVSVIFNSTDTSIVTVSTLGLVRSKGPAGSTTVVVQGAGRQTIVPVTVTQAAVAVVISPADTSIRQGGSLQYRTKVIDTYGDSIPGQTVTFTWTDSSVVAVSGTGVATAIGAAAEVYVIAHNGPRQAFAHLVVRDTSIIARVPIPSGALGIAASGDVALVTSEFANKVRRINLVTATATDSIAVGALPIFIAFNGAGTTAYVTNFSGPTVGRINVATNTQTSVIPVHGSPVPVAPSADGSALFVTTDANQLYKIALANDSVVDSIALPQTSHHLLMHPNDTLLYVATRDGGSVLEVNWRTMTVARTFTTGGRPQGMAMSLDRTELYVADETANVLRIVNLATGTQATPVTLAGGGEGLALSADGTKLFVGLVFAGKVQVIDRVGRTVLRTIATGGTPREIAVDAARSRVLVANEGGWVDILH